jgi:hypothetical protein
MDVSNQIATLMRAIEAGADMATMMQDDERRSGYRVVRPGDEPIGGTTSPSRLTTPQGPFALSPFWRSTPATGP